MTEHTDKAQEMNDLLDRLAPVLQYDYYNAYGVLYEAKDKEGLLHEIGHWVAFPALIQKQLAPMLERDRTLTSIIGNACAPPTLARVAGQWEMRALAAEIIWLRRLGFFEGSAGEAAFLSGVCKCQDRHVTIKGVRRRLSGSQCYRDAQRMFDTALSWVRWGPDRARHGL